MLGFLRESGAENPPTIGENQRQAVLRLGVFAQKLVHLGCMCGSEPIDSSQFRGSSGHQTLSSATSEWAFSPWAVSQEIFAKAKGNSETPNSLGKKEFSGIKLKKSFGAQTSSLFCVTSWGLFRQFRQFSGDFRQFAWALLK